MSDAFNFLSDPGVLALLIPIVAILGVMVNIGLKNHYKHQERMEKIKAGMDPDA